MKHRIISALMTTFCIVAGWSMSLGLPIGDIRSLADFSDLPILTNVRVYEVTNWRGVTPGAAKQEGPGRYVLLDEQGPGCIVRTLIFSLQGSIKVYFDGGNEPEVDVPLKTLFGDWRWWEQGFDPDKVSAFPFLMPLCLRGAAHKNNCYVPMPYAKSVKAVWEGDTPVATPPFYTFVVASYPQGTAVATFSSSRMRDQESTVRQVAATWGRFAQHPWRSERVLYPYDDARAFTGQVNISPCKSIEMFRQDGAGAIVSLRLRAQPWTRAVDRLLVLRGYWDGEQRASVETPIGDLCASHSGSKQVMLPVGGGAWYHCYFPMPFTKGARLTLENLSRCAIPWLEYEVTVRSGTPAASVGRFCARWHRQRLEGAAGEIVPLTLLSATGAGKLVGFNLYAETFKTPIVNYRKHDRLALYVDGEAEPRFAGASLMLYFNNGWYTGACWDSPLSSNTEWDYTFGSYADCHYFLNDAPTWQENARLILDVKLDDDAARNYVNTVCWYRSAEGNDTVPPFQRSDMLLPVRHYPNSIEAEDLVKTVRISAGDLLVVEDIDGGFNAMNGKFISFAPQTEGDTIALTIPMERAGRYYVNLRKLCSPSGGLWRLTVNDKGGGSGAEQIEFATPEPVIMTNWPAGWWRHGEFDFMAGDNTLVFTALPSFPGRPQRGLLLGLDALWIEPVPVK